jgi:methylated-DNA-protein-cysteine methyltransferase-like protein
VQGTLKPFQRIYAVVARIPRGKVATYGQVARLAGRVTARLVGYAMAATPDGLALPWQRVVNSRGEVSPRKHGAGHLDQRRLLEREGVHFDERGRIELARHAWRPTPPKADPATARRPAR